MGQYYYRPIPSGYEEVGRSIGAGITGGVENYQAGKDRARLRKQEDLELDVMLANAGGGRGPRPTEMYQPGERETTVSPDGIDMFNVQPMERRDKPGFIESGDGEFYFRDPKLHAEEQERAGFELGETRKAAERERLSGLGTAGQALTEGRGTAAHRGAFRAEGLTPPDPIEAATVDPDDIPEIGSIEFSRAFDIVESIVAERNPEGYQIGSKMSDAELIATTKAILRHEDPFGDGGEMAREVIEGSMAGYPSRDIEAVQGTVGWDTPASALVGGGGGAPAAATGGPSDVTRQIDAMLADQGIGVDQGVTDQSIDSILAANPDMSDEELAELLRTRR